MLKFVVWANHKSVVKQHVLSSIITHSGLTMVKMVHYNSDKKEVNNKTRTFI